MAAKAGSDGYDSGADSRADTQPLFCDNIDSGLLELSELLSVSLPELIRRCRADMAAARISAALMSEPALSSSALSASPGCLRREKIASPSPELGHLDFMDPPIISEIDLLSSPAYPATPCNRESEAEGEWTWARPTGSDGGAWKVSGLWI